jgi:hypothetical protein
MPYSPLFPTAIVTGLRADNPAWPALCENHNAAHAYSAPIVAACGDEALPLVSALALAGTFAVVARWTMLKNRNNARVRVTVTCAVTAAAQIRVSIGGGGTATEDVTPAAGWQAVVVDVVPSGSASAPHYSREMTLQARDASGGGCTLDVLSVLAVIEPTDTLPGSVTASGWARALADPIATADEPIPSERVERLINGPRHLAHDRPVCVASLMQEVVTPRAWVTGADSWAIVAASRVPAQAGQGARYAIGICLVGTGAEARVIVAGQQHTFAGVGWHVASGITFPAAPGAALPVAVALRNTAAGTTRMSTLQIWRWPVS